MLPGRRDGRSQTRGQSRQRFLADRCGHGYTIHRHALVRLQLLLVDLLRVADVASQPRFCAAL